MAARDSEHMAKLTNSITYQRTQREITCMLDQVYEVQIEMERQGYHRCWGQ